MADDQALAKVLGILMPVLASGRLPDLQAAVRVLVRHEGEALVREAYEMLAQVRQDLSPDQPPAPSWEQVSQAPAGA